MSPIVNQILGLIDNLIYLNPEDAMLIIRKLADKTHPIQIPMERKR